MSTVNASFSRDNNRVPITSLGFTLTKAITYVAGTTGAIASSTLFTTTGVIAVRLFAACSTDLTSGGAATIEAGIAGNTASLLAQTTATDIDSGTIWVDTGPATVEALPSLQILSGTNITQTIASATITGGVLTYYALWFPISSNGNLVAA